MGMEFSAFGEDKPRIDGENGDSHQFLGVQKLVTVPIFPVNPWLILFQREHPHGSAFRHLRKLAGYKAVEGCFHAAGVATPAGVDGDVLFAVDHERRRRCKDSRRRWGFP